MIPREIVPGSGMLHPVPLGALVVLVLNDHWWKRGHPSFVTGKLSDVAGLIFFPLLLQAIGEIGGAWAGVRWGPSRRALLVAIVATAVIFGLAKTWAPMNALVRTGDAALPWRITGPCRRWGARCSFAIRRISWRSPRRSRGSGCDGDGDGCEAACQRSADCVEIQCVELTIRLPDIRVEPLPCERHAASLDLALDIGGFAVTRVVDEDPAQRRALLGEQEVTKVAPRLRGAALPSPRPCHGEDGGRGGRGLRCRHGGWRDGGTGRDEEGENEQDQSSGGRGSHDFRDLLERGYAGPSPAFSFATFARRFAARFLRS